MTEPSSEPALLKAARGDDGAAFARLVDNLVVRYRTGPDAG